MAPWRIGWVALALATAACSSESGSVAETSSSEGSGATGGSTGPLAGTIDGLPFVVGYSRASFVANGEKLLITLRNEPVPCGNEPAPASEGRLEVNITLPPMAQTAGSYTFGEAFMGDDGKPSVGASSYVKAPDGTIHQTAIGLGPDDGSLTIQSLDETAVSGHLSAHSTGAHVVNVSGTFEASLCPSPDAGADGG